MPRKKTRKEDIQNPKHYFAKWLRQEKRHYETTEYERREKEISLEALEMTDREVSFFCSVNQCGELYACVGGDVTEFSWMEEIGDYELYQILMDLSYAEKQILTLRIEWELSHKEIAEILGVAEDAARHRVCRVLNKVKKIFSEMSQNEEMNPYLI